MCQTALFRVKLAIEALFGIHSIKFLIFCFHCAATYLRSFSSSRRTGCLPSRDLFLLYWSFKRQNAVDWAKGNWRKAINWQSAKGNWLTSLLLQKCCQGSWGPPSWSASRHTPTPSDEQQDWRWISTAQQQKKKKWKKKKVRISRQQQKLSLWLILSCCCCTGTVRVCVPPSWATYWAGNGVALGWNFVIPLTCFALWLQLSLLNSIGLMWFWASYVILQIELQVAMGAEIILRRTFCTIDGLVNGAISTIVGFEWILLVWYFPRGMKIM